MVRVEVCWLLQSLLPFVSPQFLLLVRSAEMYGLLPHTLVLLLADLKEQREHRCPAGEQAHQLLLEVEGNGRFVRLILCGPAFPRSIRCLERSM
jgi:hypothetical protein